MMRINYIISRYVKDNFARVIVEDFRSIKIAFFFEILVFYYLTSWIQDLFFFFINAVNQVIILATRLSCS